VIVYMRGLQRKLLTWTPVDRRGSGERHDTPESINVEPAMQDRGRKTPFPTPTLIANDCPKDTYRSSSSSSRYYDMQLRGSRIMCGP
jgi:hypothetical protein